MFQINGRWWQNATRHHTGGSTRCGSGCCSYNSCSSSSTTSGSTGCCTTSQAASRLWFLDTGTAVHSDVGLVVGLVFRWSSGIRQTIAMYLTCSVRNSSVRCSNRCMGVCACKCTCSKQKQNTNCKNGCFGGINIDNVAVWNMKIKTQKNVEHKLLTIVFSISNQILKTRIIISRTQSNSFNTNRSLLGMAQWWSNRLLRRSSSVLRVLVRPSVFLSSFSSWASVLALSLASVDVSWYKVIGNGINIVFLKDFVYSKLTHINTFLFKGLRKGIAFATSAGTKRFLIIGYLQRANLSYNRGIWILK